MWKCDLTLCSLIMSIYSELRDKLKLALSTLGRVRLAQVAARAVGKATLVMDMCLEYVRQRQQFNTSLGDFQLIQKMLADWR